MSQLISFKIQVFNARFYPVGGAHGFFVVFFSAIYLSEYP